MRVVAVFACVFQYLPASSSQALEERKQAFFARTVCMSVCFLPFGSEMSHVRVDESRFKSCLLQGSLKQKKNTLKKLKEIDAIEVLEWPFHELHLLSANGNADVE